MFKMGYACTEAFTRARSKAQRARERVRVRVCARIHACASCGLAAARYARPIRAQRHCRFDVKPVRCTDNSPNRGTLYFVSSFTLDFQFYDESIERVIRLKESNYS